MKAELTIEKLGAAGDGIASYQGKTVYVPLALPGEVVEVSLTSKKGKGFEAELLEIKQPAVNRVKPVCRHFGTCGGCNLQHLDEEQLAIWKAEVIQEALEKHGITDAPIAPTKTSPPHSRRRVDLVASKRKKGAMIGYHVKRSHQVFDVGDCPLITPALLDLVKPLRALMSELMDRNSKARLSLTDTATGVDLLINGEFEMTLAIREKLAAFASEFNLSRIAFYDTSADILETISEARTTEIQIGDKRVPLAPGGFLQATESGQQFLIQHVKDHLDDGAMVADLFAGCGTFSLPIADRVKSISAYESDPNLVLALKIGANRQMLAIDPVERDLFRQPLLPEELKVFDIVIIDPPRAGAAAQVAELALSSVPKIIFISCNPSSFARDAKTLMDGGYSMGTITPVDQFNWSNHVELATIFTKPRKA
ncbi:23S rRNA (uracil(1939)-C(5))-methyltransferase RlmD [Sneathiella limimaris]|uniref:23S rRNA (uracil(1939)-C(5))-methyltransferase RlmD n=1 Tax=Sneathiella limimaris TaxID=1964213 RepID=UPI00146A410A|nr:23S rRNA (uracil(1939)-C(5))-methyltransferase RlmD [Sneathiella limimaris]